MRAPRSIFLKYGLSAGRHICQKVSVSSKYAANLKAGDIIKHLAQELGGKGGGKPDLAQGGAPLNEKFEQVMADLTAWLAQK